MFFFLLRQSFFRALWPIWVPLLAYRFWRRLSPHQKTQVKSHARRLGGAAVNATRR